MNLTPEQIAAIAAGLEANGWEVTLLEPDQMEATRDHGDNTYLVEAGDTYVNVHELINRWSVTGPNLLDPIWKSALAVIDAVLASAEEE